MYLKLCNKPFPAYLNTFYHFFDICQYLFNAIFYLALILILQKRVATPAMAIKAGADFLVVGRPITRADDPRAAADAILLEMSKNRLTEGSPSTN